MIDINGAPPNDFLRTPWFGKGNGDAPLLYYLICGGASDEGYCGWRIDDEGVIQQELLPGFAEDISWASVVCSNGKFYITKFNSIFRFNLDGTLDTLWQTDGSKGGFGSGIFDLALDAAENLYVVNTRPGIATSGDTIWKLDSDGEVIWSTYSLNYSKSVNSVVVGSDGFVYVAGSPPTGTSRRGMRINPADGAILKTYSAPDASYVAIDDFGFLYLAGKQKIYRYESDTGSYLGYIEVDNWGNLTDVFVQSGGDPEDTKVFMTGQHEATNKSVWKFNYDFSVCEATYAANYSSGISEDTDGNLLIAGSPFAAGEDGEYQIVKLQPSDLAFLGGIKFNDSSLKHVLCQNV